MTSIFRAVHRTWQMFNPPTVEKRSDALKFGILGAAAIAPMALVIPSKSHPEIIIYAVAARDKARATAYAKKHGIPNVRDSYQALLDDPEVDAVYIALPNSLHFEWAMRALNKGKHVLLEKPSTSSSTDAEILFRSPLLSRPNGPVLMEAFHNRFTPAWACLEKSIDRPNVAHVHVRAYIPSFIKGNDDIRWKYELGGGCMLDLGTYHVAALRDVFGAEPEEIESCEVDKMPAPLDRCDGNFKAKLKFAGGGMGEIEGGMRAGMYKEMSVPTVAVTHRPVDVDVDDAPGDTTTAKVRKVTLANFLMPGLYHRVDIEDEFVVTSTETGEVVKRYSEKQSKKAYTFRDIGVDQPGEPYWQSYRYMLEQFVNRIRGRQGTGIFITHEDSLAQMRALDMLYEKSGLGVRPSSEFQLETSS